MILHYDYIGTHDRPRKVKSGHVMLHKFIDTDPPQKGNANSLNYDANDCPILHYRGKKDLRAELRERNMSSAGNIADAKRRCKNCNPHIVTKLKCGKVIKMCAGKKLV